MEMHNKDPYDPDTYGPPGHGSIMGEWMAQDAYMDQWRLLAQHAASGGQLSSAPYPALERYDPRFVRDAAEGIQGARGDASQLEEENLYDPKEILDTFRQEDEVERQNRALRAQVYGGEFTWPEEDARLHTTLTRLFTHDTVHDVCGVPHEPHHIESASLHVPGPVTLLGLRDIEIGAMGDGNLRLDVVDADSVGPGSGTLVVRLTWGDPSTIVGAAKAGEIRGPNRWIGVGTPGASQLMVDDSHLVLYQAGKRLRSVDSPTFGSSVWVWTNDGDPWDIYVAVDAQRRPVGLILDSSGITRYYWTELDPDEDDDDYVVEGTSDWPEDAREFDLTKDVPGFNPNRSMDAQVKGWDGGA